MALMAKILSWRFCHLNIVGCLLKGRPTKGESRAPQYPPLATPLHKQVQRLAHLSRMGKTCFLIFICLHYIIAYQAKRLELLTRMY